MFTETQLNEIAAIKKLTKTASPNDREKWSTLVCGGKYMVRKDGYGNTPYGVSEVQGANLIHLVTPEAVITHVYNR